MNKTEELIKTLKENLDRELIFLYPDEGTEYAYTLGYPSKILIDEYWVDDDIGRVWLRHDNEEEMFDHYSDNIFDELYPNESYTDEKQEKVIDKKTKEFIDSLEWKKCICVYISY